ncbi:MAG TPA: undecaprenyl-diphosphatase UppP [Candidatus Paceibacterota bacterium]
MDILPSALLGLVQGLTEFIPVSSSGHLILTRELFGIGESSHALAFDAVLQLSTALAVGWYFRTELLALGKALWNKLSGKPVESHQQTLFLALALGTIPAVLAGLFLEETMNTVFRSSRLIAWTLIAGALLMFIADRVGKQGSEINLRQGFLVGLFQMLALVPGISRSGATISGGLFLGLTRETATRFSFLLGFPILLGSGLKKLYELWSANTLVADGAGLLVGSVVAFLSGLAAIHFLVSYLKRRDMTVFVVYRLLLAALILFLL